MNRGLITEGNDFIESIRSPSNDFEVRTFIGVPGKSQEILGYEPRVTLEEGLKTLRERMLPTVIDT